MKVFFRGDDEVENKLEDDFKKRVFVGSEDIHIEFFNIDKKSEIILNEAEKIQQEEENSTALDESTKKRTGGSYYKKPRKYTKQIFKYHRHWNKQC